MWYYGCVVGVASCDVVVGWVVARRCLAEECNTVVGSGVGVWLGICEVVVVEGAGEEEGEENWGW